MFFVLCIPLIIFIVAQIAVIYHLINIIWTELAGHEYATDVFIYQFRSTEAILYTFILMTAIFVAAWLYAHFAIRPYTRAMRKKKLAQEFALRNAAPGIDEAAANIESIEKTEEIETAEATEIAPDNDLPASDETAEDAKGKKKKAKKEPKVKKEKREKKKKKKDGDEPEEEPES